MRAEMWFLGLAAVAVCLAGTTAGIKIRAGKAGPETEQGVTEPTQRPVKFVSQSGSAVCGNYTAEILFLYDVTGSFQDDLPIWRLKAEGMLEDLLNTFHKPKFAIASFKDKIEDSETLRDYCYKLHMPLTTSTDAFIKVLNDSSAGGGGDDPEAHLDAMYHGLMSKQVGWSEDVDDAGDEKGNIERIRLVVLVTDAPYHLPGENTYKVRKPHDERTEPACEELTYPSEELVAKAFAKRKAIPLFLIGEPRLHDVYQGLIEKLGRGGVVQPLEKDSSDLTEQIFAALEKITCGPNGPPPPPPEGGGVSDKTKKLIAIIVGSLLALLLLLLLLFLLVAFLRREKDVDVSGDPQVEAQPIVQEAEEEKDRFVSVEASEYA